MVRDWGGGGGRFANNNGRKSQYLPGVLAWKPLLVLPTGWLPKAQEQGWVGAKVGEQAPLVGAGFDKV